MKSSFLYITYLLKTGRPLNMMISVISVWVALYISGGADRFDLLWYTGITAAFLIASANILNDVFDLEIDKINRPDRPIPAGKISGNSAIIGGFVFLIIAVTPNFWLSFTSLMIILTAVVLIVLYSPWLKVRPVAGNIAVSLVTSMAFLYGASAAGNIMAGYLPCLIAFFIHLIREILKDMEDREGDQQMGVKTIASTMEFKVVNYFIMLLIITALVVIWFPYYSGQFDFYYLMIVLVTVFPILLYVGVKGILLKEYQRKHYNKSSSLMKAAMLFGLVAFIAGV